MRFTAIRDFNTTALLSKIFGDKPFQVQLIRSQTAPANEQDPAKWRWDVKLPLDNPAMQRQFLALITPALGVDNDQMMAMLTITANPTNIGYEAIFAFDNASFRKRGKRKLEKLFAKAHSQWVAAKEGVAVVWEGAMLQMQLVGQVNQFCLTEPALVETLKVRFRAAERCPDCQDIHPPKDQMIISLINGGSSGRPGTVMFYEFDAGLSSSGYAEAVIKSVTMILKDLAKQSMVEFMNFTQEALLADIPVQIQEILASFAQKRDQMTAMGLEVKVDPRVSLLITTLQTFMKQGAVNPHANVSAQTGQSTTAEVNTPPMPPGAGSEAPSNGAAASTAAN